jgi:hypothetical protein
MEKIEMTFFTKHNPKIDPRSRVFVEKVAELLTQHGLTDDVQRKKCSFYLFQSTIKYYKKMQSSFDKGVEVIDEVTADKQATDMAGILSKYGITEPEKQEEFLLQYFSTLTEMGMWPEGKK